jgi:hypothetical protein
MTKGRKLILGAAAIAAGFAIGRPGRAQACLGSGEMAALVVGAIVIPSDVGVWAANGDAARSGAVLGWAGQFPLPVRETIRHRVVGGLDLYGARLSSVRGRVAYRYGRRTLFGGLGWTFDGAGGGWSPEIGVNLAHMLPPEEGGGDDMSLHVTVRAEVTPGLGRLRGATLLFGWNVF